ncbi:P-loop containing nucleoside triphosphate hydrolase protein [Mycena olivaceomarginata]|nr:P-loop containing nucleoside triphosphate hydrolase protein [Mycena olivaceomarginata]
MHIFMPSFFGGNGIVGAQVLTTGIVFAQKYLDATGIPCPTRHDVAHARRGAAHAQRPDPRAAALHRGVGARVRAGAEAQRIAKSMQETRDFSELLRLPTRTDESDGFLRPHLDGAITFNDVGFSYPGHVDAPVLQNINLQIQPGECVAIISASGSGKTTIAALLQRLYEPTFGSISIGLDNLRSTDVAHLRQHVSIVSQWPTLFDATITENIAYGSHALTYAGVRRAACVRGRECARIYYESVAGLRRARGREHHLDLGWTGAAAPNRARACAPVEDLDFRRMHVRG